MTTHREKGRRMDAQAAATPQEGDQLIDLAEIRRIFRLGRTAAYELTHRPDFPAPVALSPRCYRWWASEVIAYTETLRHGSTGRSKKEWSRPSTPAPGSEASHRIVGTIRPARGGAAPADTAESA
jgi:predicted DNA-binding transcriptional regulator AlpA